MNAALRGHLAMLFFSALVAGSFSLGVMAAPHVAPAVMNSMRFMIASVLVGCAALATTGIPGSAFRAPWRYFLLGGVFATYFVLMFEGLKTAAPVSASAVFTLTPIMTAIAGYVLLRQITTRWMAVALAIGGAGAVWVIFRADIQALLQFQIGRGEAIYFLGCVAHAIYIPMVPKLNRGEPAIVFTFGMLVACTIIVTLWGVPDYLETDWASLPNIVWVTLIYIAVFASAITFVLLQYASMRLPSAKVMAYTYLTPSWVLVWEIALGHGVPPVAILGGVALSVLALLMLLKGDR
jgi:drug/metabolite transporter (DMT)-like permease